MMRTEVAGERLPRAGKGDDAPLAFTHVRIFDGKRVMEDAAVVVEGGRIAAAGREVQVPANALTVEGWGCTLLPGLIDGHVHVLAADALRQELVLGITTAVDCFMDPRLAAELKRAEAHDPRRESASLVTAGSLATAPGGHGTEFGVAPPPVAGPEEADAWVRARVEEGSDFIKLVYDDGAQHGISYPTLSLDTVRALVRAAHARGLLAVAHVATLRAAREVLEAGVDGLAHVWADKPPDEAFCRWIAERGAFVCPTLCALQGTLGRASGAAIADDPRVAPFLSERSRMNLRHAFPVAAGVRLDYAHAEEAVRRLHAAGVPLLAGSDVPNPGTAYGATLHRELELLVQAGLPPAEALACATFAPARAFRLADRGRIAAGLRADLLLVRGDPTDDVTAARDVAGIWIRGVPVDREAFRAQVARGGSAAPEPEGAADGRVSDFDGVGPVARFGFGWTVSTDRVLGGASTAEIHVVPGGAGESAGCLRVRGQVRAGAPFTWAGAIYHPGPSPVQPANLSRFRALRFHARGDGGTYRVILFSRGLGVVPAIREFRAGPAWSRHTFPLREFSGMDGHDLTGVLFSGGPAEGPFTFWIDDVEFV
ncbi:MAG TPA: CIA30 family protein [Longimicrobium sp.]|nr:CIA30 family protein [Longimicrobium sp.]